MIVHVRLKEFIENMSEEEFLHWVSINKYEYMLISLTEYNELLNAKKIKEERVIL